MSVLKLSLISALLAPVQALANPACVVCAVAIGAGVEVAERYNMPRPVTAVWIGAFLLMSYYMLVKLLEKIKWNFTGYKIAVAALTAAMIPLIYRQLRMPLELNAFGWALIAGALAFEGSQAFYEQAKARRKGKALFPFEKVVLALLALIVVSLGFYFV